MYIGDAIAMGLCTDIVPFYKEDNEEFERVDWSNLEKMYPEIRFERIIFRAEINLKLAFDSLLYYEGIDPDEVRYLRRKMNISVRECTLTV